MSLPSAVAQSVYKWMMKIEARVLKVCKRYRQREWVRYNYFRLHCTVDVCACLCPPVCLWIREIFLKSTVLVLMFLFCADFLLPGLSFFCFLLDRVTTCKGVLCAQSSLFIDCVLWHRRWRNKSDASKREREQRDNTTRSQACENKNRER